ncbi:MAG: hypothetical protein ACRDOL_40735 [Streptosporangiaceae bacterium]
MPFRADPRRPIAVVDERTYRQAARAADRLAETGDFGDQVREKFVITAITLWLRYEVRTGRRSRRADRAARLEQWELRLQQLNELLGLGG